MAYKLFLKSIYLNVVYFLCFFEEDIYIDLVFCLNYNSFACYYSSNTWPTFFLMDNSRMEAARTSVKSEEPVGWEC